MKRKDGKPKAKALRTLPRYEVGFRESIDAGLCGYRSDLSRTYTALSLFSGCGGLDLGFHGGFPALGRLFPRNRISILEAHDSDPDCVAAYELNLGSSRLTDLSRVGAIELPKADILLGGFPCQDFSSSGTKLGTLSERGQLYQTLVEYAARHHPRVVVGENVPLLAKLHGGRYLHEIADAFEDIGYRLTVWRVVCQEYGLPQSRTRLFLIACPEDGPQPGAFVADRSRVSIDEALADLESISDESVANQSQYFVSDVATAGGGQGDHVNERGRFAYTIRANPRGRIQFHYALERRLTVRECARLQGFPDSFVFPYTTQRNVKLIGNAVPPTIAHLVAQRIVAFLDGIEQDLGVEQMSLAL